MLTIKLENGQIFYQGSGKSLELRRTRLSIAALCFPARTHDLGLVLSSEATSWATA
jgi:hypothetical protein